MAVALPEETGGFMKRYKVHLGGRRNAYFATLDAAVEFCNKVFREKNVVLSIVEVK